MGVLRRLWSLLVGIFTLLSFVGTAGLASVFAILFYFGRGLPDHAALTHFEPVLTNRFFLSDGAVWRDYSRERRFFTSYDAIPHGVVQAFLVAEDKNFFIHPGLDLMSVFRAAAYNTLSGKWKTRPVGASTITQQVAKNFLLGSERSFERKIKEAILAIRIEKTLDKKRILELYLNQIYLGAGAYGVAAAAETYFQKKLDELSWDEVAFLAALPKAPENYQPNKNPSVSKARRDWVLDRLHEEGFISGQDYLTAKARPIATTTKPKNEGFHGDYFIEAARQQLIEKVGLEGYMHGGHFLHTTVIPAVQKLAHRSLQSGLESYDKRYGYRGPLAHFSLEEGEQILFHSLDMYTPSHMSLALVTEVEDESVKISLKNGATGTIAKEDMAWARKQLPNRNIGAEIQKCSDVLNPGDVIHVQSLTEKHYKLTQVPEVTGGIVVLNKNTGEVYALSGGYDFTHNQFNNATQALRQPGSSFKPFVYLAALEKGFKKETKLLDAPLYIPLGFTTKDGRTTYSPKNMSKRYYGPTSLENALAYSRNVITVRLAMQIGMRSVERVVKTFGLYEKLPRQFAMVLGAGETTLLKLTTAYAMLGNGGKKINPTLFTHIENRQDKLLYRHDVPYKREPLTGDILDMRQALASQKAMEDLHTMLLQVVQKGTGRQSLLPIAQKYRLNIGGKTGTSNDYKDTWFIGFASDIAVGVFVGFANPRTLGEGQTGSRVAAPIAADFLDQYFTLYPPQPEAIVDLAPPKPKIKEPTPEADHDEHTDHMDTMDDIALSPSSAPYSPGQAA